MSARKFTLRHTFDESSIIHGPSEVHFGVPWSISLKTWGEENEELLTVCLTAGKDGDDEDRDGDEEDRDGDQDHQNADQEHQVDVQEHQVADQDHQGADQDHQGADQEDQDADREDQWSVSFTATYRIENGKEKDRIQDSIQKTCERKTKFEFEKVCDWETLIRKKYVPKGKLTVEIDIIITEMNGFAPTKKRNFDAPREHLTDVVLIVGDQKFHVSKVILAEFSDFFKSLFFNGCRETSQTEITLKKMDPDMFQMLLEVIHGDVECINENTVEDILHLARQCLVKVATQRCTEFLMKTQNIDLKSLFRLASNYNLLDLQDHLLEDIISIRDCNNCLKRSVKDMDDDFIAKLIRKVYQ